MPTRRLTKRGGRRCKKHGCKNPATHVDFWYCQAHAFCDGRWHNNALDVFKLAGSDYCHICTCKFPGCANMINKGPEAGFCRGRMTACSEHYCRRCDVGYYSQRSPKSFRLCESCLDYLARQQELEIEPGVPRARIRSVIYLNN